MPVTDRNVRRSALIGLAITAVLVVATMSVGALHVFQRTYTVKADFVSASGIGAGDPVRVAGVEVGKVRDVERRPRAGLVRVSMSIDEGTWLARDTRASIRLRTLLGARYVSLDTPPTGRALAAGAVIPATRTSVPVELDATLDALSNVAEPFDVDSFNRLVGAFAEGLDGHGEQLNGMLVDLADLSSVIAAKRHDIDRLIAAGEKLAVAVDDRRAALGTSIDGFATILGTLAERREQLTQLVGTVKALSDRLTPLLESNRTTLDAGLKDLITTVGVLDRQRARLDVALGNLPEFARRLIKVSDDGSFINVYYVGTIPGPYLSDPVDLGSSDSNEPGRDGGLPRLWVERPVPVPDAEAGGSEVKGGDESPDPPSDYGRPSP